ncbi:MAG: tRNA(Ile)-lysidine synthase [Chlamydiae bacterium]|nr:tRNA(Ile)-lysidine synthase [Chlamydiota bacterium]
MKERTVKDFLSLHLEKGAKLLLGLSGGPDSMALLYFLLEARQTLDFSLHLAHIDHGWREESGEEALALQNLAAQLKLPLYIHTLRDMSGSDLENRCREERLAFFKRLHKEHHFQALLLAHHSGDQAETVLKRLFEGAGLRALGGLQAIKLFGDLPLWRPLLSLEKSEILSYLDRKHIPYFDDPTNRDPTYLRSRMREEIFPEIERKFGKRVKKNCLRLGALCQELSTYFEEKSVAIEKKMIRGPFGDCLPLEFHPVELKYFLRRYVDRSHLSSEALDLIILMSQQRRSSRKVHASPFTFYIDRSHLIIVKEPFPNFFEERERWRSTASGSWLTFWQGEVAIPEGDVQMESLLNVESRLKKKMKKWYASRGVPAFFYDRAPIFLREGEIVGECLTGCELSI